MKNLRLLHFLALFLIGFLTHVSEGGGVEYHSLLDLPFVQEEILQLEIGFKNKTLKIEDQIRLGELYFLTSQCGLIPHLQGTNDLRCVCRLSCDAKTEVSLLESFRKQLEEKKNWFHPSVQTLWKQVRHRPEALYWAIKVLRLYEIPKLYFLRKDLEKQLESLERS